jgi:hypothetical protein
VGFEAAKVDTVILAIALVPWSIAAWAMLTMVNASLIDQRQPSFWWLFGGSFLLADYNRKYFRTFAICVLAGIGFVAVVIVLAQMGWLKL